MSTRYVWAIWNTETKYAEKIWETGSSFGGALYSTNARTFAYGSSYNFDEDDGEYSIIRATERNAYTYNGDSFDFSVPANCYFLLSNRYPNQGNGDSLMYKTHFATSVHIAKQSGGVRPEITTGQDVTAYRRDYTYIKGQSITGYASSANSGQYPDDALSRNVWYAKQGSDNIDPSACSIPSTILGGKEIQINVTPGTDKVYSGTVSYLYQVKLGDGEWTTIVTTTATSQNYTVPYGTSTFQVRVRAQDNLGFTSTDYVTSSSVTVINNQPPTAPGSIEVTNVIKGQTATITITAATDPDGTIESYIYERSIDGSAFTQITNVNALSQTDQISADWGTVAYRACAVDDDGDSGPYVTSETTTVNSGWIIISGPTSDMGDKPAPFNFIFTPNVTGQTGVTDISVVVTLDGEEIYNDTPDAGQEVSIYIDTRLMITGEHTIQILATKEDFLEANGTYTFNIPSIALPDGGIAEMLQNSKGDAVFPYTLARLVIGKDGKDLNELLEGLLKSAAKVQVGTYKGTGTHGASSPNSLAFDFDPKFILIISNSAPFSVANIVIVDGSAIGYIDGNIGIGNVNWGVSMFTVIPGDKSVSWYGDSYNYQSNMLNRPYYYVAIG